MRIVEPSVVLYPQETNPFKQVERAGRLCYKSLTDEKDETAKRFFNKLAIHKHTAMLEHATFIFSVDFPTFKWAKECKYLNCTSELGRFIVSGNLIAINESGILSLLIALYKYDHDLVYITDISLLPDLKSYHNVKIVGLKDLEGLNEVEFMKHARLTFHFTTDRGVTHEIVRHRKMSFAQESTRYCNYSQGKFDNQITVVKPTGLERGNPVHWHWVVSCADSEVAYLNMLKEGATPQTARAVLPNSLKTEIIVTAVAEDWVHFFNLRSVGTTGAPHPDIKFVSDIAFDLYKKFKEDLVK